MMHPFEVWVENRISSYDIIPQREEKSNRKLVITNNYLFSPASQRRVGIHGETPARL